MKMSLNMDYIPSKHVEQVGEALRSDAHYYHLEPEVLQAYAEDVVNELRTVLGMFESKVALKFSLSPSILPTLRVVVKKQPHTSHFKVRFVPMSKNLECLVFKRVTPSSVTHALAAVQTRRNKEAIAVHEQEMAKPMTLDVMPMIFHYLSTTFQSPSVADGVLNFLKTRLGDNQVLKVSTEHLRHELTNEDYVAVVITFQNHIACALEDALNALTLGEVTARFRTDQDLVINGYELYGQTVSPTKGNEFAIILKH